MPTQFIAQNGMELRQQTRRLPSRAARRGEEDGAPEEAGGTPAQRCKEGQEKAVREADVVSCPRGIQRDGAPAARAVNGRGDVVRGCSGRGSSQRWSRSWRSAAWRVTVAHVVSRSGVSRRTFYELFDDREDCFLAAFEEAVEHGAARVLPAYGQAEGWVERMRAGLRALLEFLDDEPGLGRLAVVDALGAGPVALERRTRVVGVLIDAVDRGRGPIGDRPACGPGAEAVHGRGDRRRGARGPARAPGRARAPADGRPVGSVDGADRAALSGSHGRGA